MLVINLFGGPGVGKSTVAAGLFCRLKHHGVNAELVTEYAKDLTWEDRELALQNQPSILGEQHARLWRLRGKVDLVVTDSPLLLSVLYNQGRWSHLPALAEELHRSYESLNFFLTRNAEIPYNSQGRNQTAEDAQTIDCALRQILEIRRIECKEVPVLEHLDRVSWLFYRIFSVLQERKEDSDEID